MKRYAKEPWFGPKRIGWGWRPLTWQGWLSTFIFVGLVVGVSSLFGRSAFSLGLIVGLLIVFMLVIFVTGGPPGRIP